MADAAFKLMTTDEFLVWDDGTPTRYELVDGAPLAMAPTLSSHGAIAGNATYEINQRARARPPCRAVVEAGIWISDHRYFEADVAFTCSAPSRSQHVEEPALLVEVLSSSTRAHDQGVKLPAYKDLSSVEEVWLIDSERRRVSLWRRDRSAPMRWIVEDFLGSSSFESGVLRDRIELDALYLNSDL
jgi:Uma2 family endonuclease